MTHPITPPSELVQQWRKSGPADAAVNNAYECHIATRAAQWGADQELEACCEWMAEETPISYINALRTARRPNPPSLKEQALHELVDVYNRDKIDDSTYDTIRRALEALPE